MADHRRVTVTREDLIDTLIELAARVARAAGAELLARYGDIEGLDSKSSVHRSGVRRRPRRRDSCWSG